MSQSAIPRLVINDQNFTSGDITTSFFNDVGLGVNQFQYSKVGNLYYGFQQVTFSNTAADVMLSGNGASIAQVAAILGITVNTSYTRATAGAPNELAWNGAAWASAISASVLDAILAN